MENKALDVLRQSQPGIANLLEGFLLRPDAGDSFTQAFGNAFNVNTGESLLSSVAGDLSASTEPEAAIQGNSAGGVTFVILPAAEINNASSAYAADNNTIYISEEFLIANASNPDAIATVILDGIGHYLDAEANTSDTPGDEGEIFAAEVTGVTLSDAEVAAIREVDDTGAVNIDGENIAVEQQQSIIYVDRDATEGANNGTSWVNAYTDLQSALEVAGASDQIWVAEGTYFPVTGTVPPEGFDDIREVSFVINNGVQVYGGFTGNETTLEQRNWQANETILSGNIGDSRQADNSYHVVDITGAPANTVIDGFTISGGQADLRSSSGRTDRGGGLFGRTNASATLQNLIVENNFASNEGGGIYLEDDSNPTITNVSFINNSASDRGGAIYHETSDSLNVSNSLFFENQSAGGGAIHVVGLDAVNIVGNTFYNNQGGADDFADSGGSQNNRTISNNIFADDEAISSVKLATNIRSRGSNIKISNNIVDGTFEVGGNDVFTDFGEGNITDEAPLFVAPSSGNFNLQLNSPGINAGDNTVISTDPSKTDLVGNPRIFNETVDIGAYEYGLYLNINEVVVEEGNDGTTAAEFTVSLLDTLGEPTTSEVTVSYATANSSANAEDFTAISGELVFAPGEATKTITVEVNGDTISENNETFFVNLSEATGTAIIENSQGVGIITNDDLAPQTEEPATSPPANNSASEEETVTTPPTASGPTSVETEQETVDSLGEGLPVYRFFNPGIGVHFYTASENERNSINSSSNSPYVFEGPSYLSAPESDDPLTEIKPVYRFFNNDTGVHLYTIDDRERNVIETELEQFTSNGIAYYAYEAEQEGSIPVYRFYNPNLGAHFYTPSEAERNSVLENLPDYQLEGDDGIAFYVDPLTS